MHFRIASVFLLAVALLAGLHQAAGQRDAELEKQLQAAIHKEVVDGDLKAAIEMYRKIVARPGGNRMAAATALLHIVVSSLRLEIRNHLPCRALSDCAFCDYAAL